jgi:NADH-quinone oxidoreductase subunit I
MTNLRSPPEYGCFRLVDLNKREKYTETMSGIIREITDSASAIAKGFAITFKNMVRPGVTENYPEEPVRFEDRYRGIHILRRDENGLEKCVACFLCAAACPSNCIYIEAADNTAEQRLSAAERYAKVYNIDYNRCIFCGYCVEACPCDAITHGQGFEIAGYDTNSLVWRKEQLLESAQAPPEPRSAPPRALPNQDPTQTVPVSPFSK